MLNIQWLISLLSRNVSLDKGLQSERLLTFFLPDRIGLPELHPVETRKTFRRRERPDACNKIFSHFRSFPETRGRFLSHDV
jgi:hypothetical protein